VVAFKCAKYKDRVPYVTDAVIDDFAERVVADYNPKMLRDAVSIDFITFIDSYLRLDLSFADIYFEDGEDPILGATSFNDGEKLKVFDRENNRTKKIILNRGAVTLDGSLTSGNMRARQLFTALHECGHWLLHQRYYSRKATEYDEYYDVACCRSNDIEPRMRRQLKTARDFLEHQANMFASAVAMPRKTVKRLAPAIFDEFGVDNEHRTENGIVIGFEADDEFLQEAIAVRFADMFGVSRQAAGIRLEKLGLVVDVSDNLVG
jgi:hypothetical protein